MTQPTTIYFGPDGPRGSTAPAAKIYLRMLLFATSKRGCVVESMFVAITRNGSRQIFPVWILGEEKLTRGSGLFVSESGAATNHHFLTLNDGMDFQFGPGEYQLDVYAKLLKVEKPIRLISQKLDLSTEHANDIRKPHTGVYFDWIPIKGCYLAHSRSQLPGAGPDELVEFIQAMKSVS